MTTQGTQVTLTIPEGALPGTLLSVPVRGGAETLKIRVPDGVGPGSTLILTQAEGSDEWNLKIGNTVPLSAEQEEELAAQIQQDQEQQQREEKQEQLRQAYEAQEQMNASSAATGANSATGPADIASPMETLAQTYQPVEPQPGPALEFAVAYTVRLDTTAGVIDIIVRPDWAPHGTRRFLELAAAGDLVDLAFYRAIKGCIVQFGLPAKRQWPPIPDDPPTGVPFLLGAVSFAAIGENTRRSTLFICIGDMSHMLGQKSWETPIGAVAESSLDVLENIDTTYGDIAEFGGAGPDTNRINNEGNAYLASNFPHLTYIRGAWPLDWQPEGSGKDSVPSATGGAEPLAAGAPTQPLVANGQLDQADIAQRAAQDAQAQALHASQLAAQAARAEHVNEAAQAAKMAQEAAQAAKAAAEAAQKAQAALIQSSSAGVVQNTPPMYAGPADQAGSPWSPGGGDPVDVPVEVKPRSRPSMAVPLSLQAQREGRIPAEAVAAPHLAVGSPAPRSNSFTQIAPARTSVAGVMPGTTLSAPPHVAAAPAMLGASMMLGKVGPSGLAPASSGPRQVAFRGLPGLPWHQATGRQHLPR